MKIKIKLQILALLLCLLNLKKLSTLYREKKHLYRLFSSLQQYTPTQLYNNLVKGIQNAQFAICQGKLYAGEQCKSMINPKIKVVYSQLYLKKIMQVKQAIHQMSQFIRRKRPSFINIKDEKTSIKVFQTSATHHNPTHYIQSHIKNSFRYKALKKLNFIKSIIGFFSNHRLPQIADQCLLQTYIPEETQGIVFGKFKKGLDNNVFCQKPQLIGVNKDHIKNVLKSDLKWINFKQILFILGIAVLSGFVIKQGYSYYSKLKKQVQSDSIFKYKVLKVKSRVCLTCKKELSAVINQPCGHFNQCNKCSKQNQNCVDCCKRRKNILQIYVC